MFASRYILKHLLVFFTLSLPRLIEVAVGDTIACSTPGTGSRNLRRCQAPYDYIPKMSYPLLQAREVLRLLAEEGIEGSVKEAEPRGDGV